MACTKARYNTSFMAKTLAKPTAFASSLCSPFAANAPDQGFQPHAYYHTLRVPPLEVGSIGRWGSARVHRMTVDVGLDIYRSELRLVDNHVLLSMTRWDPGLFTNRPSEHELQTQFKSFHSFGDELPCQFLQNPCRPSRRENHQVVHKVWCAQAHMHLSKVFNDDHSHPVEHHDSDSHCHQHLHHDIVWICWDTLHGPEAALAHPETMLTIVLPEGGS